MAFCHKVTPQNDSQYISPDATFIPIHNENQRVLLNFPLTDLAVKYWESGLTITPPEGHPLYDELMILDRLTLVTVGNIHPAMEVEVKKMVDGINPKLVNYKNKMLTKFQIEFRDDDDNVTGYLKTPPRTLDKMKGLIDNLELYVSGIWVRKNEDGNSIKCGLQCSIFSITYHDGEPNYFPHIDEVDPARINLVPFGKKQNSVPIKHGDRSLRIEWNGEIKMARLWTENRQMYDTKTSMQSPEIAAIYKKIQEPETQQFLLTNFDHNSFSMGISISRYLQRPPYCRVIDQKGRPYTGTIDKTKFVPVRIAAYLKLNTSPDHKYLTLKMYASHIMVIGEDSILPDIQYNITPNLTPSTLTNTILVRNSEKRLCNIRLDPVVLGKYDKIKRNENYNKWSLKYNLSEKNQEQIENLIGYLEASINKSKYWGMGIRKLIKANGVSTPIYKGKYRNMLFLPISNWTEVWVKESSTFAKLVITAEEFISLDKRLSEFLVPQNQVFADIHFNLSPKTGKLNISCKRLCITPAELADDEIANMLKKGLEIMI